MFITLCLLSVIMLIAQIPLVKEWFIWNVDAIYSGEIWRIFSGNLTHFNLEHLAMNMLGLWLMVWIFHPTTFSFKSTLVKTQKPKINVISELILPIIVISVLVGIALLFTNIHSYVGLSGTLHGLFGFYTIREYLVKKNQSVFNLSLLLVLGLLTKVISEQFFGSLTSSQQLIGSEIATQAHFSGAISGLCLGVGLNFFSCKICTSKKRHKAQL